MPADTIKYVHSEIQHNLNAPSEIIPYLVELFHPKSVVDVGCGLGTFLHVFYKNNVTEILGIDGNWVDKSKLFIPVSNFQEADVEKKLTVNRKFDLVLCLEVAEHLTEDASGILIDNLTDLGDIIIFSAAIKNQGGQNHLNEQPFNYWKEKFDKKGFHFYDVFRDIFWNNDKIDWWYRQNMFLVIRDSIDISKYHFKFQDVSLANEYIHPQLLEVYAQKNRHLQNKLDKILEGKSSGKLYIQLLMKMLGRKFLKNS